MLLADELVGIGVNRVLFKEQNVFDLYYLDIALHLQQSVILATDMVYHLGQWFPKCFRICQQGFFVVRCDGYAPYPKCRLGSHKCWFTKSISSHMHGIYLQKLVTDVLVWHFAGNQYKNHQKKFHWSLKPTHDTMLFGTAKSKCQHYEYISLFPMDHTFLLPCCLSEIILPNN